MINMQWVKKYLFIALKGMAMGAADIVPGVSGGTVAFITGIYQEFLDSLKKITPSLLIKLKREGFKSTWNYINGTFLLFLFVGILISLKTGAAVVGTLLDAYPLLVWGFFSGLILASIIILLKQEKLLNKQTIFPFLIGGLFVVGLSSSGFPVVPVSKLTFFIGGFVAITAMILPGISGSFILLLVGLYPEVIRAINESNWPLLLFFLIGCLCGLMVFSRFLSWLLNRFRQVTIATLIGFLFGSLYVTWPWKLPLKTVLDSHGEARVIMYDNVLPQSYALSTGLTPQIALTILSFITGFMFVLICEGVLAKPKNKV